VLGGQGKRIRGEEIMKAKDIVTGEITRQVDSGCIPSLEDFVIAGRRTRGIEIDTTIKAVLEQTPKHCSQHEEFVDECMACHDVCNENIDWDLLDRLKEVKKTGRKDVVGWVEKNKWIEHSVAGYDDYGFRGIPWQAQLKVWEINI